MTLFHHGYDRVSSYSTKNHKKSEEARIVDECDEAERERKVVIKME